VVDGMAYTPEDMRRVEEVLELFPGVKSMVRAAPQAVSLAVDRINEAMSSAGLLEVSARRLAGSVLLEGTVESEEDLRKTEALLRALGTRAENLVTIGARRMVLSDVHFLEVRRADLLQAGVRLPTDLAGQVSASAALAGSVGSQGRSVVGSYQQLVEGTGQWSLRLALDQGYGRLLAQPTLVCASGEQAEFLAGGEVPVPLINQNTSTVEYRKYGILLRIRPTAERSGNIHTEIEAEVSELDRSVAVAVGPTVAVPGFRNRSVRTNVTVRQGETIVLSGVYSHDEQKTVSKVPLLGHIPILGELFKQRTIDASERELLIFVTPRLVTADSETNRQRIDDQRKRYDEAEGEVRFNLLD
jgi:pilus assembly protein CpaC